MNDVLQTSSEAPGQTTPTTPAPTAEPVITAPVIAQPAAETYTPIVYADLLPPEGFQLHEEDTNSFLGIMNNRDLSPAAQAQALLELQASLTTKSSEAGSQAWNEKQQNWQAEIAADPVLGGPNLERTMAGIGNLMDRFATQEIRQAFDETGAGNNPQIVRFLTTLFGELGEGTPVPSGGPSNAAPKTQAERMFGSN